MQKSFVAAGCVALLFIAACGGGGGGGGTPAAAPAPAPAAPTPSTSNTIAAPAVNVQPISVEFGPSLVNNILFTTVTICAPGSAANCQTIDHVAVDTASTGLRINASVLASSLSLVQQRDSNGNALAECAQFASGVSWGSVKVADIRIAGEIAASVPIQIINDPAFPSIPAACSSRGAQQTLFANGLLGIGMFLQDCGSTCASSTRPGFYFGCPTPATCQGTLVGTANQVQNPVAMFSADNNGIIIELPSIPASGAATVSGSLVFGIGTRANNALGSATVFPVDATGSFTTVYKNQTLDRSFVDTGSNANFFPDATIPVCPGGSFYCPDSTQSLSATIQGTNGTSTTVNFEVANAFSLLQNNPNATAFNNLAGPMSSFSRSFDWGLPFYFGRNVFTAFSGRTAAGIPGPYIAF